METGFPKESPVGRLYEDIKRHAFSQGFSLEKLEKEIDVGYVEDAFYVPYSVKDTGKISTGEVFEYAYRFKEYYAYLHKHGFPVPFAMDDFDPKTKEDESARCEISKVIADIKLKLAQDKKLVLGSDDYKMEFARKIHEWGLQKTSGFSKNPLRQLTAWQSYNQKEGECTEKNAILYYAYEEAGLNPSFFQVDSLPPTLEYFFALDKETSKERHLFVGFPLQDGKKWVYADLSGAKEFNPAFSNPIRLTPRQFVQSAYLGNLLSIAFKKEDFNEGEKAVTTCKTIAPYSFFCSYIEVCLHYSQSLLADKLEAARKVMDNNKLVFLNYPELKRDMELQMEAEETALGGDGEKYFEKISKRMEWLKELAKSYPKIAAERFFYLYELLIGNAEQNLGGDESPRKLVFYSEIIKRAKSCILESIALNQNLLASFWSLKKLLTMEPSFYPEFFDFLHNIALKNPQHAVAHYLAASSGLKAIQGKSFALTEKDIEKIASHVTSLETLEPDHPLAQVTVFDFYLYQGKFQNFIDSYNAYRKKTGILLAGYIPALFWAYLHLNQQPEMLATFKEIMEISPDGYEGMLGVLESEIFNHVIKRIGSGDKKATKTTIRGELVKAMDESFLESSNALVEILASGLEKKERARILYSRLLFYALLLGSEKYSQIFKEKMGKGMTPDLEKNLLDEFVFLLDLVKKEKKPLIAQNSGRFEKLLLRLAPFLVGNEGKEKLSLGYMELTLQYLCRGDFQKAKGYFDRSIRFNPETLTMSIYGNEVVKELFKPFLDTGSVVERKLLEPALLGLELGFYYRHRLSKELRYWLKEEAYKRLLERYQALNDSKKVAFIKKRLETL